MIVIVDSDGLIGSLNNNDIHYPISQSVLKKLAHQDARLIYPSTTIAETVTLLQGRLQAPELANQLIMLITSNQLNIESIDVNLLQKASQFMDFQKSEHNTLFDAIVAAVAQKYHADAIFSFDGFYKKKGFKLASEL